MRQEVAPVLLGGMAARTAGWKRPIDFDFDFGVDDTGIWVRTYPSGEGAKYWLWVSRGVAGHPIIPRRKWSKSKKGKYRAALSTYKYSPFTTPGGGYGGSGTRTFYGYRRRIPWWPGIAPRHFEERVVNETRSTYYDIMEKAIRRAVQAAQREGS